jgi:transposase, IS30 family
VNSDATKVTSKAIAQNKTHLSVQWQRQQSKTALSEISYEYVMHIRQRLTLYHSLEQIAVALKHLGREWVCHETIDQMLYPDPAQMGADMKYLRQAHPKRRKRSGRHSKGGMSPNRVGIEQRPAIADKKREVERWEGDTVIGAAHSGAIATYVDKASKYLIGWVILN